MGRYVQSEDRVATYQNGDNSYLASYIYKNCKIILFTIVHVTLRQIVFLICLCVCVCVCVCVCMSACMLNIIPNKDESL